MTERKRQEKHWQISTKVCFRHFSENIILQKKKILNHTKEEIEILVHGARNLPLHSENNVSIFASIKSMSDYENKIASKSTTTLKQTKNPNWVSLQKLRR